MDSYYLDGGAFAADPNDNLTYWSGGRFNNSGTYIMCVAKSTNGGSIWTRYNLTTGAGYAYAIAVQPGNSDNVYAGGAGGLYQTTNGGGIWNGVTNVSGEVHDIVFEPTNPATIYIGTSTGIFKTTNGGIVWNNIGCSDVNDICIDPDDMNIVYAGTANGAYITTNGGNSWSQMNNGLDDTHITSLGINPGVYLFAGTETAAMYRWNLVGVVEHKQDREMSIQLSANPNPSFQMTHIKYQLENKSQVNLSIYDAQGRLVQCLVNDHQDPGVYNLQWPGYDENNMPIASGIYFCKLTTSEQAAMCKLIIMR